jgi:hypothetical protein
MKNKIVIAAVVALGGFAIAQPKAPEPKKEAPKAPEAKKEAPAIKAPEPAKMPEMKPAPEVAAMAKGMAGNWKCTGKMVMDPMKADMTDFTGTFKAALDPTKYWVKGEWSGAGGKMKGTMFVTYDAMSKKWFRHMMNNMGGGGMESSDGLPAGATEGKMTWMGEHHGMGMQHKTRNTEEIAAKSNKMTSEMSMDGGKTWKTMMEMTCTK